MNRKKITGLFLCGFFLFCLIRLSQYLLIIKIPASGIFYLPNFFSLQPYYNTGLALGLPLNNNLLIEIIILIIVFLIVYLQKLIEKNDYAKSLYLILILSGAFSNLIERIRFGYVFDFFQLWLFPIFNLADVFITLGAVLLIINLAKNK